MNLQTPPIAVQGRAAARRRPRSSSAFEGAGRRSARADRAHAGRHADRQRLRRHDAAAPARPRDRRAARGHRRLRHAEPPRASSPAARRRRPKSAPCATTIVAALARRRRIAGRSTADDVDGLMRSTRRARKGGDFEARHPHGAAGDPREPALRLPRSRKRPPASSPAQIYRISDLDLASRLSFFLWGTVPGRRADRRRARSGTLSRARRARAAGAADARRSARRGAGDALRVAVAAAAGPRQDPARCAARIPYFDDTLADAMRRETELFFEQHRARGSRACSSCSPPTTRS